MPRVLLVVFFIVILAIDGVAASRTFAAAKSGRSRRKGHNRVNRRDFKARGGVRKALGNSTITKLARRARLKDTAVVRALANDEDLVRPSSRCAARARGVGIDQIPSCALGVAGHNDQPWLHAQRMTHLRSCPAAAGQAPAQLQHEATHRPPPHNPLPVRLSHNRWWTSTPRACSTSARHSSLKRLRSPQGCSRATPTPHSRSRAC